ncbi:MULTISPECIES: uroporphyrinogen decarboxylase family protein [unclassified Oceanispirochaeta]|uniref:uroporphyrinogen decarboxylase family protein n=1 Tax=unclassified Oceanispirochaeta TaxID=2635722 RepID=UPI000E096700|nr:MULTISPECIES: uroporphyrinogen decarboxylase family protein [unclassified Oceanispirochaeta]MBF9016585.1 hypothetical protein [Oceanispirochaeta sp. M2]NPD73048.1 hypothetical protein [Oceanispirochaeta sp. M1]RDG31393.1 hypothetical protein DV872_13160 [Oceanispirochaeta sp. M1]
MKDSFDTSKADSQGTKIKRLSVRDFDIQKYQDYESMLLEKCREFTLKEEGVAVYRRFRVPEVYSWACSDKKRSLELQLSALQTSMSFKTDIPNFLEPWYGIGVISSAFGVPYIWKDDQAPAVDGQFKTAKEALSHRLCSVAESREGKHVLEMIEYFLDQTKGKIPMSLTDTQSPLNIASSYLMDSTAFMYEIYDNPDDLKELMIVIAEMEKDFIQKQLDLIGDALVKPGHGFASARNFSGLGFSDDNFLMFSDEDYKSFAIDSMVKVSEQFAGPVFHSCGNWTERSSLIQSIPSLLMADGAVGNQTDPSPNDPTQLGRDFADTGIILHTRIVGNSEIVSHNFNKLWRTGLKCIVATYCETPEDQFEAYASIMSISQK